MKINASLAKSLLLFASFGLALPVLAQAPAKPAPAKPGETAKEEPEPVIPGTTLDRKDGSFIGLELADGGFKLSFYDKKKKQVACDVAQATARWNPNNKKGDERRVLNLSGDGKTLVSNPPVVRPPYIFKLYLTLLSEDGQVVESFPAIDFRG
jgi:hypothetical protein